MVGDKMQSSPINENSLLDGTERNVSEAFQTNTKGSKNILAAINMSPPLTYLSMVTEKMKR